MAPWLTAYLLLVSLGLPLQRVYCACVGEAWVSLPTTDHECHHAAAVTVAHDHGAPTCCHPAAEGTGPAVGSLHDCGDSELLLAQLDADFTLDQEKELALPAKAQVQTGILSFYGVHPRATVTKTIPIRGPTPPPAPAGRVLLVAHQTFLL